MDSVIIVKLAFYRTLFSQSAASVSMGSLAAVLRDGGWNTELCFLEKDNWKSLGQLQQRPTGCRLVIVAKINFKDQVLLLPLLARLKDEVKAMVFLVGPYAMLNAQSLVERWPQVDGVVMGQLETTVPRLLEAVEQSGRDWEAPGVYRINKDGKHEHQPIQEAIPLDSLPFPARDIESREVGSFINIEASRGCLYNCTFCHVPITSNRGVCKSLVDTRDPVRVVDEMEQLQRNLGKNLFIFNDSVFWASSRDNDRLMEFCGELKRRKLNVRMYVYLRCVPFIDDKVLEALVEVGLVRVFLGVENASANAQKVFRKPIGSDTYLAIRDKLEKMGVNVHIGYITFEPYATLDDVRSNFEYLRRIDKTFRLGVILEPVRVIPSGALHRKLVADGLLTDKASHEEITYGYQFSNPGVGQLHSDLKSFFSGSFGRCGLKFEYYCTTMDILHTLARRSGGDLVEKTSVERDRLLLSRKEMSDSLHVFLMAQHQRVADGLDYDESEVEEFRCRFRDQFLGLEVRYNEYVNSLIQAGAEEIISMVYTGQERLK